MQNLVRFWTPSKLIVFVAFGFMACVSCFPAITWAEWLNRYNGPANSSDWPHAIAVDGSGNVYVTGSSYGVSSNLDYATIKYDADGNRKWARRYNGPGNDWDVAWAIAVDNSGNVYVTGESAGSSSHQDYATIKYDADGNRKWVRRYNGPGNWGDTAFAIALDARGNVYVTGSSDGSSSGGDFATIKYSTAGKRKWVKRYNGLGNGADSAQGIAVDGGGNVYVTGYSEGIASRFDYATIKYDMSGNFKWVRRYNGPGNEYDWPTAIAVDANGNVFVTGTSYAGSSSDDDYATIKYDTNGNPKWVNLYSSLGDHYDSANGMALDLSGNVHVTGNSYGPSSGSDYITIKYDTGGNRQWTRRYTGPGQGHDRASAIAVDHSGNVYVTGESGGTSSASDYATAKYDTDGNRVWVRRYNGPGNYVDSANAIAVDADGNVYVTGSSDGGTATGSDYATIKYDPNGN